MKKRSRIGYSGRARVLTAWFIAGSLSACEAEQAQPITTTTPVSQQPVASLGGPVQTPVQTPPTVAPTPGVEPMAPVGPVPVPGPADVMPGPGPADNGPDPVDPPNDPMPGENAWVMMGYEPGSTYHNPVETVLTKENAGQLEVAWRADMGDNVYGAPLQVGGVIYASSGVVVQAFDAETGDRLWRNTRAGTTASLVYDEGTIYLHTNDSKLMALDAATGDQKFEVPAGPTTSDGSSSPILAGDVIVIGGSNGSLELSGGSFRGWVSALDKATGQSVWSTHTVPDNAKGASVWSSVAVDLAAGRVYATTGNNHGRPATDTSDAFLAFSLEDGALAWKNQRTANDTWSLLSPGGPDADFGANPVAYQVMIDGVATPMVSAGQKSGDVHGVRRDDGTLVWTRKLCGGSANGSLGIFVNSSWSGKHMLFACNTGAASTLYALDGATGDMVWEANLPGLVYGRISSANGVGFVGAGRQMVIFDSDSGDIIKMIPSEGGTVTGTVTIVDGRVAYGEGMSWSGAAPGSTLTVLHLP